ncbi:MAG: 6,7-dimethyl-8-ribityllumazine synthase [Acidobacteria bacterium]|nr:6,7-dimethyl-8-ribityllumazine synthase [Acidobacteriota bacterium]
MPQIFEGQLNSTGLRVAIVVSRFNDVISSRLLDGAVDALLRTGADDEDIHVFRVPGSFEIPLAAKKLALQGKWDAVVCLGALVRGDTPHFDLISAEVTKGIAQVALETGVPMTFGVVTADTVEQAINRAGLKSGNKGFDAAMAAVELANLMKNFQTP